MWGQSVLSCSHMIDFDLCIFMGVKFLISPISNSYLLPSFTIGNSQIMPGITPKPLFSNFIDSAQDQLPIANPCRREQPNPCPTFFPSLLPAISSTALRTSYLLPTFTAAVMYQGTLSSAINLYGSRSSNRMSSPVPSLKYQFH